MNFYKHCVIWWLCWSTISLFVDFARADALAEAKKHLDAGLAYYDDPSGPRYEEAYREFHAAYAISPSYKLLANIGTCALYLERDEEAIDAYERYLKQAKASDIPAKKRALMQSDVDTLRASLVRVNLQTGPDKLTLIDERFPSKGPIIVNRYEVEEGSISLGIHPGAHRITAHREGYEDQRWEFDAQPASSHSHRFELVPTTKPGVSDRIPKKRDVAIAKTQPRTRTTPVSVYIGLAATAALAGAATVTGLMAMSSRDEFASLNDGTRVAAARDAQDEMRRNVLMSDIAFGAALLSAGVTTYLYLTRPYSTPERDSAPRAAIRLAPTAGSRQFGLSLTSTF